jgi:hypothetical protein
MYQAIEYVQQIFLPDDHILIILIFNTPIPGSYPPKFQVDVIQYRAGVFSEKIVEQLQQKNAAGWHVYIAMNAFASQKTPYRRRKQDVASLRTAYIELDYEGDAGLAAINAAVAAGEIPAPHFVLQSSPGKYHVIWKISGIIDYAVQESLNRALQIKFGGDAAAIDSARVLRLPGFKNVKPKYGPAFPEVSIVQRGQDASRFALADFHVEVKAAASHPAPGDPVSENTIAFISKKIEHYLERFKISVGPWNQVGEGEWRYTVTCPNAKAHTDGRLEAAVFLHDDGMPGFKCLHGHCADFNWKWLKEKIEEKLGDKVVLKDVPRIIWHNASDPVEHFEKPASFVESLIYCGVMNALIAKPKVGKTTFILDAIYCITHGKPFLKRNTTIANVLYVSEQPLASFYAEMHNSNLTAKSEQGQLEFATTADWYKFSWPEIVQQVGEIAVKNKSTLVVFDTLSRIARVKDENDASEMQNAIDKLNPLLASGIAPFIVQHERKAGGDIYDAGRGTNALAGGVDVMLRLRLMPKMSNQRLLDGVGRLPLPATSLVIERKTSDSTSFYQYVGENNVAVANVNSQNKILMLWASDRDAWLSENDIVDRTQQSRSTVKRVITRLIDDDGFLESRGGGSKVEPFEYRATSLAFVGPQDVLAF